MGTMSQQSHDTDAGAATAGQSSEHHFIHRIGWLRAAVLGANDGIVSTASLIVGVAAAASEHDSILIAGTAGLVAGAMSMAAGEYVSVSSQFDTEQADLAKEREALAQAPEEELAELAEIYAQRGVEAGLAEEVAAQLMAFDDLAAHARDELGISETVNTRPLQAALTSAATFSIGALLPLTAVAITPVAHVIPVVSITALVSLGALGSVAARAGGASVVRAAARVILWGALAIAATAGIGAAVGTAV
jgi:VIT1/CCC1 family predicted Fe2+/Mn2+ transporter